MSLNHVVLFSDAEVIFDKGDEGNCAYIIDRGRIEIFLVDGGTNTPVAILGPGEIFGEMAIVDGSPRSAGARAVGDCSLTVVSKDQLYERIESADPVVRLLVRMLIKRIRENNEKLISHKTPVAANDVNVTENPDEAVINKIRFEKELNEALKANEFVMHYQPIINLKSNEIAGFEALIRWDSPQHGLVRPDLFMGLAEETSLIVPISDWVFDESCKSLKLLSEKFPQENLFMSINISGKQFSDPDFFDKMLAVVKKHGVQPSQIKLEVTETLLVEGDFVKILIDKCRELGFNVSLDDFGTGYSSLSYLSDFSFDNLKIDKSFVKKMGADNKTAVIVQSIVSMSKGLEVPVIAEGIETLEDLTSLTSLGCEYGQGYYFSKPVAFSEAEEMLSNASTIVFKRVS